ncbi:hypothetical protein SLNHY_2670 [Streptomyces albus]|nr:hypothetical protein SLNHY_2670 [Streptomyces albus]
MRAIFRNPHTRRLPEAGAPHGTRRGAGGPGVAEAVKAD